MENDKTAEIGKTTAQLSIPTDAMLFENGFGYFLSYMAIKGLDDLNVAIGQYVNDAIKYYDERTKGSNRYTSGSEFIKKKLDIKKRQYNKVPIEST